MSISKDALTHCYLCIHASFSSSFFSLTRAIWNEKRRDEEKKEKVQGMNIPYYLKKI